MWTAAHFNWLADISMEHHAQQVTLQEYIDTIDDNAKRVDRLTIQIRDLSGQSCLAPLIKALQAMRGIPLIVATTMAAELGDLRRFANPAQMMAYLGLVPSEHTSGEKTRRGGIRKTGNGYVRKVLIEAAQAYRLKARKSRIISKRQENLSQNICRIAWKAQTRLCGRYWQLAAKVKKTNVVKTAIAREIAGFCWAIAQEITLCS